MKTVAVIQARMGSTRLPGKVLADLEGAPMRARVVGRAGAASRVDEVWVACSDGPADDPIAEWCHGQGLPLFRGSEQDVLGRFVGTALAARADLIVRLTADCPLLDPALIDRTIAELISHQEADYASNVLARSYPRGLDVEAFTMRALARMDTLGRSEAAREHVTVVVRLERPDQFVVRSVVADRDDSDLRWTVDTRDDLEFVRTVYRRLGPDRGSFDHRGVVVWCRANPELARTDDNRQTWDPSRVPVERGR
jgi:spore coat polysaccharide biosynthesis protein SpsF (cytidylyltransferase family)